MFFVDGKYFVIADEAIGTATGKVNLHFQLCDGKVDIDSQNLSLTSDFEGDSQVKLQCFAPQNTLLEKEEGWYSTAYRKRKERTAVAFNFDKKNEETTRFITVIYPATDSKAIPSLSARFKSNSSKEGKMEIEVTVDNRTQVLEYQL